MIIRLPLAILLGIIISIPIEIKIFEPEIIIYLKGKENERQEMLVKKENNLKEELRESLYLENFKEINEATASLENKIKELQDHLDEEERKPAVVKFITKRRTYTQVQINMDSEKFRMIRRDIDAKRNELRILQNKKEQKQNTFEKLLEKDIPQKVNQIMEKERLNQEIPNSLLSKYKALNYLSSNDPYTSRFSLWIRITIILIEIMPIVLNLLTEKKQYERLIEQYEKDNSLKFRSNIR